MDSKSKSLDRSKRSGFKLVDIGLAAGISISIGPAGALCYGTLKVLGEHAKAWMQARNEERLNSFHERLLGEGISHEESEKILNKDLNPEDYYMLLKAAIQDDEDKKSAYYAELLRNIILSSISEEYKVFFLKASKELTSYDIELLQKIYVFKNYDLVPSGGSTEMVSNLFYVENLSKKMVLENLQRLGFLEKHDKVLHPTDLALKAATVFFRANELTPASIGRDEYEDKCTIIILPLDNEYTHLAMKLHEALRSCFLKPGAALYFNPELLNRVQLVRPTVLVIIIGPTEHQGFSSLGDMDELAKQAEIPSFVKVLKVITRHNDNENFNDYLPSIKADAMIYFDLDKVIDFSSLEQVLKELKS